MEFRLLPLAGCVEIQPRVICDDRGRFVKTFHAETFRARGLEYRFDEEFHSESRPGVIRGLHFQAPPADHVKVVRCLAGVVRDAVVDLRRGSPTYGRHLVMELSAERANLLYIPRGFAHGFEAVGGVSVVAYMVSTAHVPACDLGIRWDSVGISWTTATPVVSPRDAAFPRLEDFVSPFSYSPS